MNVYSTTDWVNEGIKSFGRVIRKRGYDYQSTDEFNSAIRGKTLTRGILIPSKALESNTYDLSSGYVFQFNPESIQDTKSTIYETRGYTGFAYNDYIWGGGGERTISFQLFLDDTTASHMATIAQTQTDAVSIETNNGNYNFRLNGNTYSSTRVHERGILDDVELLQSFLYPDKLENEKTPMFASGGVISANQFRPPASVIFSFGKYYIEGVIKSAPVSYSLFDTDLTPLRATIDIEIGVYEFINLDIKEIQTKNIGTK